MRLSVDGAGSGVVVVAAGFVAVPKERVSTACLDPKGKVEVRLGMPLRMAVNF